MQQTTNDKPETVKIEIEITRFSEDFIKAYSKLAQKTPETLYKKILMTGIRDIIGTIKHLPHTNLDKFIEVMEYIPKILPGEEAKTFQDAPGSEIIDRPE